MSTLATAPTWQSKRAMILHDAFTAIDAARRCSGAPLGDLLKDALHRLQETDLGQGKYLRLSDATIRRAWDKWYKGGKLATALLHEYKGTNTHALPAALSREVKRLASSETGGRDKHQRGAAATDIRRNLEKRWHAGQALPDIGTWQEWWMRTYPRFPLPAKAPEFPWATKTIIRHSGVKALKALGNLGHAAMQKHTWKIECDYSKLRKCQLYTLDDVRLDLAALDDNGKAVTLTCYILMEVASRYIVAHVCKPDTAIRSEDVDELLAHGLSTPGFGIGIDYPTTILFERGTVACSKAAELVFKAMGEDRIRIFRTGIDHGVRWTGAAADRASGKSNGKAVIESWNRKFHHRLIWLRGQRGNNAANQPRNLGIEFAGDGTPKDPAKDTTVHRAERLHKLNLLCAELGQPLFANLPLHYAADVMKLVGMVIADYNNEGGHGMQGFHRVPQIETAPGVWEEQPYQNL